MDGNLPSDRGRLGLEASEPGEGRGTSLLRADSQVGRVLVRSPGDASTCNEVPKVVVVVLLLLLLLLLLLAG